MIFTYDEIEAMPTLCQGHTSDLKYDNGEFRIWLSRCTIADGELDPIQVERLIDGCWIDATRDPDSIYLVQGQGMRAGVRGADGQWVRTNQRTNQ